MKYYMDVDWEKYGIAIPHCLAPWKAAFIQADGLVRPCCIYPPVMGNTNKKKLEVIWNDEPYRKLRLAMLGKEVLPEICANCHDSMRHVDIDWYLRHAIEERIEESEDAQPLEALLTLLVKKNYMVLPAVYLLSKTHRKKGEQSRELYCLLSCKSVFDSPEDHHRIEGLRKSVCEEIRHGEKVVIDAVFFSRLLIRLPDLTVKLEQMLGREYSSADAYMEDMNTLNGKSFSVSERKKVMLEYKFYNDPILLGRWLRQEAIYGFFSDRIKWLFLLPLRSRSFFLRLSNRAYEIFDQFRKSRG